MVLIKRPFGTLGESIWTLSTLVYYHTAREQPGAVAAAFPGISRARANALHLPGRKPGLPVEERDHEPKNYYKNLRGSRMRYARRRINRKAQESREEGVHR